jgi:uncharacterized MAPEG superfamily protein
MTYARFTVAYWCLLVAALLPIACAVIAKWGMIGRPRLEGGYDNNNPRAWLARQNDWRARVNHAQANTFEALPFFFAAVIIAHQLHAFQVRLDIFAFVFVVLRIGYIMMYAADMATSRSVLWALALLVNVGILFLGYR